jgi:predicted HAD superfamily Cof-like phosphohydrolase
MVREFHMAFGLPAPDETAALPLQDRLHWSGMFLAEIGEFLEAQTAVGQVRELLDISYLATGVSVAMAYPLSSYNPLAGKIIAGVYQSALIGTAVRQLVSRFWRDVGDFVLADSTREQAEQMLLVLHRAFGVIEGMGYQPRPLFEIVHQASMNNMWLDGRIVKPPNWPDPDEALVAEMERQRSG